MLSVEELEKACEFADGFEIANTVGDKELWVNTGRGTVIGTRINENNKQWELIYYPLFLQRVIEGMNKGDDFSITQHWDVIEIEDDSFNSLTTIGKTCIGTIDQAKEQAIKYILENI